MTQEPHAAYLAPERCVEQRAMFDAETGELLIPIDPAMFVHVPMGWGT